MAHSQVNPLAALAPNPAVKRKEGYVVLCATLWTLDRHIASLTARLDVVHGRTFNDLCEGQMPHRAQAPTSPQLKTTYRL